MIDHVTDSTESISNNRWFETVNSDRGISGTGGNTLRKYRLFKTRNETEQYCKIIMPSGTGQLLLNFGRVLRRFALKQADMRAFLKSRGIVVFVRILSKKDDGDEDDNADDVGNSFLLALMLVMMMMIIVIIIGGYFCWY